MGCGDLHDDACKDTVSAQVQITLWACERVPKDVSSTRQIGPLLEGVGQSTGRGGLFQALD